MQEHFRILIINFSFFVRRACTIAPRRIQQTHPTLVKCKWPKWSPLWYSINGTVSGHTHWTLVAVNNHYPSIFLIFKTHEMTRCKRGIVVQGIYPFMWILSSEPRWNVGYVAGMFMVQEKQRMEVWIRENRWMCDLLYAICRYRSNRGCCWWGCWFWGQKGGLEKKEGGIKKTVLHQPVLTLYCNNLL